MTQIKVLEATTRSLIRQGAIPAKRVGGQYRVLRRDLERWIEGRDA